MKHLKLFEQFKYHSESQEEEDLISLLKRECSPFLKEFNTPLFRGYSGGQYSNFEIVARPEGFPDNAGRRYTAFKKQSRLDDVGGRRPESTPSEVHWMLNERFVEKFGVPVRNGVFTSFDAGQASRFGEAYYFFPVGNYRYFWSIWEDLYSDFLHDKKWVKPDEIDFETEWNEKETYFYNGKNIGYKGRDRSEYHVDYKRGYDSSKLEKINPQDMYGSFKEYEEVRTKEYEQWEDSDLNYIMDNYQEGNHKKILKNMSQMHKQRGIYPMTEITFWCDEYIMVDRETADEWNIFHRLFN